MGSHLWALSSPTFILLPATSLGRTNLQVLALAGRQTFTPSSSPRLPATMPSPPWPRSRAPASAGQRRAFAAPQKSSKNDHSEVFLPQKLVHLTRRAGSAPGSASSTDGRSPRDGAVPVSGTRALLLLGSWRAHPPSPKHASLGPPFALRSSHPRSNKDAPTVANPTGDPPLGAHPGEPSRTGTRSIPGDADGWLARLPFPAKLRGK